MKTLLVVLLVLLGGFCLLSSGMYIYMTIIGFEGGSYIKPAVQTGLIAIVFMAAIVLMVIDIREL